MPAADARPDPTPAVYSRLSRYLARHALALSIGVIGFVLYTLGTVLIADLLQFLLDALGDSGNVARGLVSGLTYEALAQAGWERLDIARVVAPLALVGVALLRALGHFLGQYSLAHVARALVHQMRTQLFDKLLVLPAEHLDAQSQGAWVGRLTFNVEQVAGAITDALKTLLRESLVLVGLLAYMAYLNWQLCLVFIAVTPVIVLVVLRVTRYFKRYSRRVQDAMGEVTQYANEGVAGYAEVRMLNAQAQQAQRFAEASRYNRDQSLKIVRVETLATAFLQVWVALAFALLVWLALHPAVLETLSAGALVAFLTAASQLGKPVRQLSGVLGTLQRGVVAAQDVFEQLDRPVEADTGTLSADAVRGELVLDNVSFTYPGAAAPALSGVGLTVQAGQTLAIVGRSGSGKSTLLRLLTRLVEPGQGQVLLDGQPLPAYALDSLRRNIAVVPQQPVFFRDTIYHNVVLGLESQRDQTDVEAALARAEALSFVEYLPAGLQTRLGDGGAGLSGGQRQRLALARAFLKDAPVLLLDEATSALDADTAARVQQSLAEFAAQRTCVVIAHRMATVEQADRIVVLDAGRVVAQGAHAQLMADGGLYAELYRHELAS